MPLKQQLEKITDLRRKRDTAAYRFYNHENQLILINMITHEIKEMDIPLPEDLYFSISPPDKLATKDIRDLSLLLKRMVIFRCQTDVFRSNT